MAPLSGLLLVVTAFATAFLSGIFGMAGGLVLMGVLALMLPVSAAFVTHGVLQITANGWRSFLHRRHIRWEIAGWYALASLGAAALVASLAWQPSLVLLFVLMGLTPLLVWLPRSWLRLDASRPVHALLSGASVTGLNLTAGVVGPLLDIFFVRTSLDRHEIVATKAVTQVFSHIAKIAVYGSPLVAMDSAAFPPFWVFALAIPLSMLGTAAGGRVLARFSDAGFKRWTAWIVTAIGLVYLAKAGMLVS